MNSPHAISVYTDGSTQGNPGPSGQGIVICYPDGEVKEIIDFGHKISTINRRELSACVEALRFLQKSEKARAINHICIYSDSAYVVDNHKKAVYGNWRDNGWKTFDGNDVDNQDLWKDLIREIKKSGKRVEIYKVKAHKGNIYNEKADKLAKQSRKSPFKNDHVSERSQVRKWLKIPENLVKINLNNVFVVYIQRTDPRKNFFDAHIQILRPKKYRGSKLKIRGEIQKHVLRGAHLYKLKLEERKSALIIKGIVKDMGKLTENKDLI